MLKQQPNVRNMHAIGWYKWPLDNLIKHFKFKRRDAVGKLLSQWFVKSLLLTESTLPDAIVAIPQTRWRYFARGFNQAAILASEIAHSLPIVDLSHYARRTDGWRAQHRLSREKRLNREITFEIIALPKNVKRIAIVDDVMTTGATLKAMTRALYYQHPDIEIDLWIMAVTPR